MCCKWLAFHVLLLALVVFFASTQETNPNDRVDCWPQPKPNREDCVARGCIWDERTYPESPSVPLCYFPRNTGYVVSEQSGPTLTLVKAPGSLKNPYDPDIEPLTFASKRIGAGYRIGIGTKDRYVPPVPIDKDPDIASDDYLELETRNDSVFSFTVRRHSTGAKVWDTSIGGLLFGDRYIQIAAYLPTDKIYGFGEHVHRDLNHDMSKYTTWGMFSRDQPPYSEAPNTQNLYGVHPFYLALEADGKAHGVFIFNSNAQEVSWIFFFPGPTPEEVVRQYQLVIGRPMLPSYWALGYQFCRYGYKSLQDMKATIKRIRDHGIPLDIAYADIDYMERYRDFTVNQTHWKEFPLYAKELHDNGMHLFLIFDPAIEADHNAFGRALEQKARFVEWPRADLVPRRVQDMYPFAKDTKVMLGVVWPDKHVGFPDFLDPTNATNDWWIREFSEFHKTLPFDGIWIDMNEPSNFATNEEEPIYPPGHPTAIPLKCPLSGNDSALERPPFQTASVYQYGGKSYLSTKTLCMVGSTAGGSSSFYDTKNIYGWSESVTTQAALHAATGKRGAVIGRSTFPSSGHYAGHWLGDNTAAWQDLRDSIVGVQEFNLFGIPYVGADVCGFNGPSNEELCLRWHQLGAFHSFYRNHNSDDQPPQDPAQWPSVANATRRANLWRYQYLPYLFTLHFKASLYGGTVVRPVFFEFPEDNVTHTLSHQFMWGSAIMVIPVLYPDVDSVKGYLPPSAKWYSLSDDRYGREVPPGYSEFPAPRHKHLPVFVRAGHVLPRQVPAVTTSAARLNEFQLLVALEHSSGVSTAFGELYWDDGESVVTDFDRHDFYHFTFNVTVDDKQTTIVIHADRVPTQSALILPRLGELEFFGYDARPNLGVATLNGDHVHVNLHYVTYDASDKVLRMALLQGTADLINLNKGRPTWTLSWVNNVKTDL